MTKATPSKAKRGKPLFQPKPILRIPVGYWEKIL
jgi:hypothetical protein